MAPRCTTCPNSQGTALVRWIAQRVLVYPTFLFGDEYISALLGIDCSQFTQEMDRKGELWSTFKDAEYVGPLSGLVRRRWWKDHFEFLLEKNNIGKPLKERCEKLSTIGSVSFDRCRGEEPRVIVDEYLLPTAITIDAVDGTKLIPDDWPSSNYPFTDQETLQNSPYLQSLIG